jgi:hypothetical protein
MHGLIEWSKIPDARATEHSFFVLPIAMPFNTLRP